MRVTVRRATRTLEETSRDLQAAAVTIPVEGSAIVHRNGDAANRMARAIAKQMAGPHGANYYKRIEAKSTGPLSVEVGPSPVVGLRYTGVGGEAGAARDLDKALKMVAPGFAKDAADLMDGLL